MPSALLLADAILYLHAAFVAFVVLAVPVILYGHFRQRAWVGNPWFRLGHLAAIAFVVLNTWLGEMCPLTIWENALREQAGQAGNGESFIAHWVSRLLFWDLPSWAFTLAYSLFGFLVAGLLWIAPIRRENTSKNP